MKKYLKWDALRWGMALLVGGCSTPPGMSDGGSDSASDVAADSSGGSDSASGQDAGADASGDGGTSGSLLAFPGAEGYGATVTGGRGGRVIHVTTLAASGPGSFQDAVNQTGPRIVVFDVSGVIDDVILIERGDITIAGQTSPGGITVRGLLLQGDIVCEEPSAPACPVPTRVPENFIVRHLRIRPTTISDPDGAGDGLRLHHARRGIIDHVSVGNAEDEAVQISFTSDVTLQFNLWAETIGSHSEFGGMLLNYSDPARGFPLSRLSIHHNMWNRLFGRLPEVSRENVPDSTVMEMELSNNVLWDARRPIYIASANPMTSAPLHYRLNMVGNYTAQNSANSTSFGLIALELGPDTTRPSLTSMSQMFLNDNRSKLSASLRDYELIYNNNDFLDAVMTNGLPWNNTDRKPSWAASARHPFPAITYTPSGDPLALELAANAGAFPRDPMDRRLMQSVRTNSFSTAPIDTNPANDALLTPFAPNPAPALPTDTDRDGMPDAWEMQRGLNPAMDDSTSTRLSPVGYTAIEVYINELSTQRITTP